MEFYYTYVCPLCCENRDNSGLKSIRPAKCRVCGKKVIAVKIYLDYLEGHNLSKNKDSAKLEASMEKDSTPNTTKATIALLDEYIDKMLCDGKVASFTNFRMWLEEKVQQ